jgi:hypothetical protein
MLGIDLIDETRDFVVRALGGDGDGLSSLAVTGGHGSNLTATIEPGPLPTPVGGVLYKPGNPFRRETLVELIVRMMRYRAARWDTGKLVEPTHEDLIAVTEGYPRACYPSLGPGWVDLLHAMLEWVGATDPGSEWRFDDLKEKYGTLRAYHSGPVSALGEEVIEATEHLSGFVCDRCGRPGNTGGRGWISTRCILHNGEWR